MKTKFLIPLFTISVLFGSCTMLTNELKKANKMRNSAQEVCDCAFVSVSSNTSNGVSEATLTINNTKSKDKAENSQEILQNLQKDFEDICSYSAIIITYESPGEKVSYSFNPCEDEMEETSENSENEKGGFRFTAKN